MRKDYLINEKTVLFYGEYQQYGELFTVVIDGKDRFLVPMSPLKLIDQSLLCYGGDFKGALKSSKRLLGDNKKMYPLKIDASLDIWIFPTKAYVKDSCFWFSYTHITNAVSFGSKLTKVFLSYGHECVIEMRADSFRKKRSNASDLRDAIHYNTKKSINQNDDSLEGFIVVEKRGQYECGERKKQDK